MLITPITVLVVDDHALVRTAISQVLTSQPEIKLVILAQDYAEAEKQIAQLSPEIIWLNLHIARSDGLAEIGLLRELAPASHILALADVEDEQEAVAAIMAGAQGYRSKQEIVPGEIMTMINMLRHGEFVLRPLLLAHLLQYLRDMATRPRWTFENQSNALVLLCYAESNELAQLTTQERGVLSLIRQGFQDREIAKELHISEKTVQKHIQHILSKLGH
jgi:DNA-binding NarL/FixJ family response regulator